MNVTLYLGDCLDVLRTLDDASVDAVVTDPPYGVAYQSAWRTDRAQWKPKIANDRWPFVWFLWDAARVLCDGGALLCFCRWDVAEAFHDAIGWCGLTIRSQVVWDRDVHGMGDLRAAVAPCHDTIWYATKGRRLFWNRRPKSVIRHRRLGGHQLEHPNEKPQSLLDELVEDYTAPTETVLDCFMGSGTTGVACVKTGRNFIGIEIDPAYHAIAERRIAAAQAEQPLFAGAAS